MKRNKEKKQTGEKVVITKEKSKKKRKLIRYKRLKFGFYLAIFCTIAFAIAISSTLYLRVPWDDWAAVNVYAPLEIFGFTIFFSGFVVFIIGLIYGRLILKPLDILMDATDRVATGDFKFRLKVPMKTKHGKKVEKSDEFSQMYRDFNRMISELESTEMLKNDFVSNVSHEIKTPVSVINNYATILQSDQISESERKDYAMRISQTAENLSVMVANILQLSKIENQKIKPQPVKYNLSEQLAQCILYFESVWEQKNIELDTDIPDEIAIESDKNLMTLVWNNLLSNALKFTPENGTVKVAAKAEEGKAIVQVIDSGCGISEKDIKHIFDKFYQAENSHTTKGNGLGLALVKEIIELTGSSVEVESKLGQGSCFTVKIPL